jgi:hypothetical protein
MSASPSCFRHFVAVVSGLLLAASAFAQQQASSTPKPPVRLTLADALDRARKNSVVYQSAVTEARIAHEDKKQAVAVPAERHLQQLSDLHRGHWRE